MCRNGQNSTSNQIFNPKFESAWALSYSNTKFGGASAKIYTCFERKMASVMQNFQNLGLVGVGWPFFDEKPKRHIPGWFHVFWAIMHANPFTGFSSRRDHEKKGHYKKSQRCYIAPICGEFPTQPNLTKIGIWLGVADVINHTKFGNDRSREYKVTEGRILACSIGMALSPITL